jgi:hypothetical protein
MTERPLTTRLTPQAREDEGSRLLATVLAPRIDGLRARLEQMQCPEVMAGSPLAGDDRVARPFQVSHAAWYGITHAVDNLHALRLLTVRGEAPNLQVVTHPYAAYPLLRAAIENASTPLWLLAPANRDTRLTRRFRLLLQDAKKGDEAADLLGHEPTTYAKREKRLSGLLEVRPTITMAACKRPAGFRVVVREAAEGHGTDPITAEVIWRLLSGLTHGDTWAGLTAPDRDEVAVSADGTVVTLQTTSSLANIANMTGYTVVLVEAALSLYDIRRTKHI